MYFDLKETEPPDSRKEGLITGEVKTKARKEKREDKRRKGEGLRNE